MPIQHASPVSSSYVTQHTSLFGIASFLLPARPLLDNHLVAILWAFRAGLTRPFPLGLPAPDGHWVLIGLGFTTSTSMRMVNPVNQGGECTEVKLSY